MPVGEATLGRMFNVVGDPIDGKGPVEAERMPMVRARLVSIGRAGSDH